MEKDDDEKLVQSGLRMKRRLFKLLKALAEFKNTSLSGLMTDITEETLRGKITFGQADLEQIAVLAGVYKVPLLPPVHPVPKLPPGPVPALAGNWTAAKTLGTPFNARNLDHTIQVATPVQVCRSAFIPRGKVVFDPSSFGNQHENGPLCPGMVFLHHDSGTDVLWSVIEVDASSLRLSKLVPDRYAALVDVNLTSSGPMATTVKVSYSVVAFTASGDELVNSAFSKDAFGALVEGWRKIIETSAPNGPSALL